MKKKTVSFRILKSVREELTRLVDETSKTSLVDVIRTAVYIGNPFIKEELKDYLLSFRQSQEARIDYLTMVGKVFEEFGGYLRLHHPNSDITEQFQALQSRQLLLQKQGSERVLLSLKISEKLHDEMNKIIDELEVTVTDFMTASCLWLLSLDQDSQKAVLSEGRNAQESFSKSSENSVKGLFQRKVLQEALQKENVKKSRAIPTGSLEQWMNHFEGVIRELDAQVNMNVQE